ncbi:sigma-70 family RNA polymerase sigma factor [Enhygromyxa salina]|uniref:RNA polymerase sigma factor SigA n=1 Tax=Enhygromyxa salina TaxID=215803 RepID=A0A2S9YLX1_9BACT|nr:sigma-70 family RNA polymerase sigma factor [Enhygromyxa salina]PRQ06080.1 RNA polymerase sigma factor SigA [Enhygromyxa salina]
MPTKFDQSLEVEHSQRPASRKSGTKPGDREDAALQSYMRAVGNTRPFSPTREHEAAVALRQARVDRWAALLGYPPLVPAICALIVSRMELSAAQQRGLEQLEVDAEQFRRRRCSASEGQFTQTGRELALGLPDIDVDGEVAELLVADVERIASHSRETLSITVARMPGDSRPFRVYLAGCRRTHRQVRKLTNEFVQANLRLVVSLAGRLARGRLPIQDAIQEGNIGLLKAVERYDHRRGFRFSTYASWWIRHAVSRASYNKGQQVRVPVHVHEVRQKLSRVTRSYLALHGREPSVEQLADETGLPLAKIEKVMRVAARPVVSLDAPSSLADGRAAVDVLEDPNAQQPGDLLVDRELEAGIEDALAKLGPMDAEILRLRYGLRETQPETLREIGERYALSRERIRQLQAQAVEQVRQELGRMQLL